VRKLIACLLVAGCDSEALVEPDLSAAPDLAAPDLATTADARDLSVPPDDLLQPVPMPDGAPVLAPAGDTAQSHPVDGITCDTSEQLVFHIHAHLQIYVGGKQQLVPAGIGIGPPLQMIGDVVVGGSCFSWLHTHDESGIIHIESPLMQTFVLGNFFDIWGQPLSTTQVGPAHGAVTAFVDGAPYGGDPGTIPLAAHAVIQLDVADPVVAAQPYTWPAGY
jgi:hypothetical protein